MTQLPPVKFRLPKWPERTWTAWQGAQEQVERMRKEAGRGSGLDQVFAQLREMARVGNTDRLPGILARRAGARALTLLWLEDQGFRQRLLTAPLVDLLVDAQSPRLSRLSFLNLVTLYFRRFDELDNECPSPVRAHLQKVISDQLRRQPQRNADGGSPDAIETLRRDGHWLLSEDGPRHLARSVVEQGGELGATFSRLGFDGFDVGRYADICRAHFYLDRLKRLSPMQWDPVFDELLKPQVARAPYMGEAWIGHAALAIVIDNSGDPPSEAWQQFVLSLAGDPRISSNARNFREWWRPLGEKRIQKVRRWLSKEDLRLFLQALEQYSEESGKEDLQRMFPARKVFLEGLFELGLVRNTRLMLGNAAQSSMRRILGKEVQTNFAKLDGSMTDKAVIYLDCSEFCLVEGSHSFKIWVYLAPPSPMLTNYELNLFTHFDLTKKVPADYGRQYPDFYYTDIVHNGPWQWRVFDFLSDSGIALDIEPLLTKEDYRVLMRDQGRPVVTPEGTRARKIRQQLLAERPVLPRNPDIIGGEIDVDEEVQRPARKGGRPVDVKQIGAFAGERHLVDQKPTRAKVGASHPTSSRLVRDLDDAQFREYILALPMSKWSVISLLASQPGLKGRDIALALGIAEGKVNRFLFGPLKDLVEHDGFSRWKLTKRAEHVLSEAEK